MFNGRKEKQVVALIRNHLEKIQLCLQLMEETLRHFLEGSIEEAKKYALRVDEEETKTDFIRRQIEDALYSGAFLPMARHNIHSLVELMDKIANQCETVCDFALAQRPDVPEEFQSGLFDIIRETTSCFTHLKEGVIRVFSGPSDESYIREKITEVGISESRVDDYEWKLTREIFSSELPLAHKLHLRDWVEGLADISDRIENASDLLAIMIITTKV